MKRKHNTNSPSCWCGPELQKVCRNCNGRGREDGSEVDLPCWRCHGVGWLHAEPDDTALLVIHQDDEADVEQPAVACRGVLIVAFAVAVLLIVMALGVMAARGNSSWWLRCSVTAARKSPMGTGACSPPPPIFFTRSRALSTRSATARRRRARASSALHERLSLKRRDADYESRA